VKRRGFKIIGNLIALFILGWVLILGGIYMWRDEIKASLVTALNEQLIAEVGVSSIDLNFLDYFPRLAVQFSDVIIHQPAPQTEDTLLAAETVAFTFNPLGMLRSSVEIDQIRMENGVLRPRIDARGNPQYIIWKTDSNPQTKGETATVQIEELMLNQVHIDYFDAQARDRYRLVAEEVTLAFQPDSAGWELESRGACFLQELHLSGTEYALGERVDHRLSFNVHPGGWAIREGRVIREGSFVEVRGASDAQGRYLLHFESDRLDLNRWLSQYTPHAIAGSLALSGSVSNESGFQEVAFDFVLSQGRLQASGGRSEMRGIEGSGSFRGQVEDPSSMVLRLEEVSGVVEDQPCTGSMVLSDFDRPNIAAVFRGDVSLPFLNGWMGEDGLMWERGRVLLALEFEHQFPGWDGLQARDFKAARLDGTAQIQDGWASFEHHTIEALTASIQFSQQAVRIESLQAQMDRSEVQLEGRLVNLIPALFLSDPVVEVQARLTSRNLILDDWIQSESLPSGEPPAWQWMPRLHFQLEFDVRQCQLGTFKAEQLTGRIRQEDRELLVDISSLETCGGTTSGRVRWSEPASDDLHLEVLGRFQNIDLPTLFHSFQNFGQTTVQAEHLKGAMSGDADFSAHFDRNLRVSLPSIQSWAHLNMTSVRLLEFEPLLEMARYIDREDLLQVDFDTWSGDLIIRDETVILPATSISSSVMDFDISGEHSFTNQIHYRVSFPVQTVLGNASRNQVRPELEEWYELAEADRPDLHLKITGTVDEPIVKYDLVQAKKSIIADFKRQGQELKTIFREEFGNASDTTQPSAPEQPDFILEWNPDGDTIPMPNR